MLGNTTTTLQSNGPLNLTAKGIASLFSQISIGVKANGALSLSSKTGAWDAGSALALDAGGIDLNSGASSSAASLAAPKGASNYLMPDAEFDASAGWVVSATQLTSIVTRAPAHEPWPYHNQGVQVNVNLDRGTNTPPPGAPALPPGVSIAQVNGL